jgi:hypothetical protein
MLAARMETTTGFRSVLYLHRSPHTATPLNDDALRDLSLDRVLAGLADVRSDADLTAAFLAPLGDVDSVVYRQEIFRDLQNPSVQTAVRNILHRGEDVDANLVKAAKSHYPIERHLWNLTAANTFVDCVESIVEDLGGSLRQTLSSRGLRGFVSYAEGYANSTQFELLRDRARRLRTATDAIRFNVLIRGTKVTVAPFDNEPDLGAAVIATFDRFRQGELKDYRARFNDAAGTDHIQVWILDKAAEVEPNLFAETAHFADANSDFLDPTISRFTREVRFFLNFLDYIGPMRNAGLTFSYPVMSDMSKGLEASDTFDMSLAATLIDNSRGVVTNDLSLTGPERVLVISGPNQGGKTTTARLFGQLYHLAAIGCPVPGRDTKVFLTDQVLTHFEREEQLDELEGRLGEDVQHVHDLLQLATPRSVIILNEVFSSTTIQDARQLTREILDRIFVLDALCVCVTFIDELSRINEKTVSMVSTVDEADPSVRTFKVERRPADGRAYAQSLADKYSLNYAGIRGQVGTGVAR